MLLLIPMAYWAFPLWWAASLYEPPRAPQRPRTAQHNALTHR
jgi:hypothetical protein